MTRLVIAVFAAVFFLAAPARAEIVTCPAVNDVFIDHGVPDENEGGRTRILVSWHATHLAARGLWRFDIPAELEGSQITSAVMVVSRNSTSGAGGAIDVDVFALNAAFNESTDTWNTLGGGNYDGSVVSSGTLPAWASAPPCTASIDLTALLQGNLDKVRTYGILMMVQGEGSGANRFQNFSSKEEVPPSTGAYLEIDYTTTTGSTPKTPLSDLLQNHPNPFNPHTTIEYGLAEDARISIDVYSVSGKLIRRLLDEWKSAGFHRIQWDGKDQEGQTASSGIYFCSLRTGDITKTRKMVLLR